MGCMVLCRTFHTAREQGQELTPIVPIVVVPVPVPDTACVITPLLSFTVFVSVTVGPFFAMFANVTAIAESYVSSQRMGNCNTL